ncbi:MAG: hypothetical protein AB8B85_11920 [Paracoccaceae bacterium]
MSKQDPLEDMMKPGREAFEYWISFFPTAPLFGVKWRFGDAVPGMDKMMPGMDKMMPGMQAMMPFTNDAQATPAKRTVKPVSPKKPEATAAKTPAAPAKPAMQKTTAPKPAAVRTEAPKPVSTKAAPATKAAASKVAAKKVAAPKAEKVAVKAKTEKAPATAVSKGPAKAAGKAKDGKPASLFAEKPAKVDDLKLIKGVGPGLEKELNTLGVYQFGQISAFSKADLTWIDNNLTAFKGRCFRDDWTGQAKTLMG